MSIQVNENGSLKTLADNYINSEVHYWHANSDDSNYDLPFSTFKSEFNSITNNRGSTVEIGCWTIKTINFKKDYNLLIYDRYTTSGSSAEGLTEIKTSGFVDKSTGIYTPGYYTIGYSKNVVVGLDFLMKKDSIIVLQRDYTTDGSSHPVARLLIMYFTGSSVEFKITVTKPTGSSGTMNDSYYTGYVCDRLFKPMAIVMQACG